MMMRTGLAHVVAALVAATAIPAHGYQVLDPGSIVEGKSIAAWNAEWWTWIWNAPVSADPLADTTGASARLDNDRAVFFIAGAGSSGSYERTFDVPAGRPLLIPMINYWENCVGDPAASCGPSYLPDPRVQMAANVEVVKARDTNPFLSIDGTPISDPYSHWEVSDFFSGGIGTAGTTLAALYGSFGLPFVGLDISPSLAYGYYAMVTDLAPGAHTLMYGGGDTVTGLTFDVTAHINVVAIPEPETYALMLAGLGTIGWIARRRA